MSLRDLAYKIAQEEGINPDLFLRQIQAESAFDPQAKSSAGAMGLAQLMPATAKELGVSNPYDPEQSLRGGAKYMKQLLGRYNNDQTLALAAYNAGMGNVDKAGGVPNFKETQNYIAKILGGNSMIGAQAGAVSTGVLPVGAGVSEYLTQSLKGNGVTDTTDYKNYSEYVKGMENPISFKDYMDAKNRKPLQNKGTYRYDNRIIGEVTFDPNSGEYFETVNGQRVPIDISKAQPVTDATFAKAIPNYGDFVKLSEGLSEDRTSMDRLQSYMKSIGNTNEGFQRLGDQMTASLKTLLSGIAGPEWTTLSKEELNAAVAKGQLQGLIGRFRIETVGGGVMTEQDALRIIANLGGDVNALQNKEIVAQQIETLFRGKLKSFDSKRKRHDAAIDALYGGMGFDKVDEYEFDEDVFNLKGSVSDGKATMTDDQLLAGTQGKTGAALSQYLQSLSEADFNRLMQLQ